MSKSIKTKYIPKEDQIGKLYDRNKEDLSCVPVNTLDENKDFRDASAEDILKELGSVSKQERDYYANL